MLAVPLELERREKLLCGFLGPPLIDAPESKSKPNPASEAKELVLNSECLKCLEAIHSSVLNPPLSQGVKALVHAAHGHGKILSHVVISPISMIPREGMVLLSVEGLV